MKNAGPWKRLRIVDGVWNIVEHLKIWLWMSRDYFGASDAKDHSGGSEKWRPLALLWRGQSAKSR